MQGFARCRANSVLVEDFLNCGQALTFVRNLFRWRISRFQFLAERAGMVPLIADRTRVAPGDWLLVPTGVLAQRAMVPEWARSPRGGVVARGSWPWSTLPAAYGGAVPIRGQPERQMTISVFRIEDSAVAREPE